MGNWFCSIPFGTATLGRLNRFEQFEAVIMLRMSSVLGIMGKCLRFNLLISRADAPNTQSVFRPPSQRDVIHAQ